MRIEHQTVSTQSARTDPTGSASTIRAPGQSDFSLRPTPVIVPPVPVGRPTGTGG